LYSDIEKFTSGGRNQHESDCAGVQRRCEDTFVPAVPC
jgi:hypothetical protein